MEIYIYSKNILCSKNKKTLMIVIKDLKKLLYFYLNFNYY